MRTEVELDGLDGDLRPGSYGSVTITLADQPDALLLPATALLSAGDQPTVLVAEDGYARRREVGVAFDDGVRVQVTSGLEGSRQVIVEGQNSVRDGQVVEIAG